MHDALPNESDRVAGSVKADQATAPRYEKNRPGVPESHRHAAESSLLGCRRRGLKREIRLKITAGAKHTAESNLPESHRHAAESS